MSTSINELQKSHSGLEAMMNKQTPGQIKLETQLTEAATAKIEREQKLKTAFAANNK